MTKEGNGLLLHETFLGAKLQLGIAEPLEYLRSLASSSAIVGAWKITSSRYSRHISLAGSKGCFWFVRIIHSNLPVATTQVQCWKPFGPSTYMETIIDSSQGPWVFDSDVILGTQYLVELFLFLHEHYGTCPGTACSIIPLASMFFTCSSASFIL